MKVVFAITVAALLLIVTVEGHDGDIACVTDRDCRKLHCPQGGHAVCISPYPTFLGICACIVPKPIPIYCKKTKDCEIPCPLGSVRYCEKRKGCDIGECTCTPFPNPIGFCEKPSDCHCPKGWNVSCVLKLGSEIGECSCSEPK